MAVRAAALLVVALATMPGAAERPPRLEAAVVPLEAHIGDALTLTLTLTLAPEVSLEPPPLGPEIGPFQVLDGAWVGPESSGDRVWSGRIAAYELGTLTLPPIELALGEGEIVVSSQPIDVTIVSLLEEAAEGEELEIADLKPPAVLPAQLGPLWIALLIVVVLLVLSALVWWLARRYGSRLRAADVPVDPFHRIPPHEWAYAQLQALLDGRVAEDGEVDAFFTRLSWILRRYLGARYRMDLLERTTAEVLQRLESRGIPDGAATAVQDLLVRCDLVKFAAERPGADACRAAVEETYRVVDATRPREATTADRAAAAGAA